VGEIGSETGMREVRDGSIVSLADAARVRAISEAEGLALCAEVSDYRRIREVSGVADVLQVGSRNMQDFNLLRELGHADRPVLLKRGPGATVEEFLLAAEYVLSHGNGRVILCESGIRTFDVAGKPRFEINAIPVIKQATHLPVIADPSQATSHGRLVPAVARAAVAAGADGLVLEVTDDEARERDGAAIGLPSLRALMAELDPIAQAVGRRM
jgi:3-deoxy-7-phosphoheptulonate synthase